MVRRVITTTAALLVLLGLSARAIEKATFILTNGERKSGDVVFHTESRRNLIDGFLNLGVGDGKEETFPQDRVAVIDFAGGTPANAELAQLPASGHFLVFRDGRSQSGTLVNLIGGDTVVWRAASGDQQFPIRDVSRIYLNAPSARTAFNYNGPVNSAVGTGGSQPVAGAIQVSATQAWTDTGIDVRRGDRYGFRSSGEVTFAPGRASTADGELATKSNDYPVPIAPVGALIGKVGNSAPFSIGSNAQSIVMPRNGRLMLGVNDSILTDNGGAFSVVVTRAQ